MSVLPPRDKLQTRRASLKGVIMQDVSQGAERVRAWPEKRGKRVHPKTKEQMEWFRQAQWACKYMAPQQMVTFANMTKGTPLLPRDIATMMMAGRLFRFIMPDGRKIYGMPFQTDVSDSLDALSQTIGTTLIRLPEGWRGVPPPVGGRLGVTALRDTAIATDAAANRKVVNWESVSIDQGAYWNVSQPSKFTVPFDGWYQCNFRAIRTSSSPAISDAYLYKNGSEIEQIRVVYPGNVASQVLQAQLLINLASGDVLEWYIRSDGSPGNWLGFSTSILGST